MTQSLDSFLSDYGFIEEVEGERVVMMKWGQVYTTWDVCPVENSVV